jgi:4-diphosphocytidyl-2-C-methyl-D-erythritol kinase
MICFPGAKINIGLNIVNKRCDGFHNIQSIFFPVNGYSDSIEIVETDSFQFIKSGLPIAGSDEDNLCYKAYKILKDDLHLPDVSIRLLKRIPSGAGLGGGSSNASSTLKLLNDFFGLNLSNSALINYASNLGSDCPFFIQNEPAYITGRGNIIEPIELDLKSYYLTIINPGFSISTKEAYNNINLHDKKIDLKSAIHQPVNLWKDLIWNDFEKYAFANHSELSVIKQSLYNSGALYSSMTGSGSSVYAISDCILKLPHLLDKYNFWQGKLI